MPPAKRLAALALAAAACRPSSPGRGLVVGNIAVSEATLAGKPEIAASSDSLRKEVRAALEASGRFSVREGGPVRIQLEIERAQRTLAPPAAFDPTATYGSCAGPAAQREPDDSLDMGTGYDCLDAASHTATGAITS